MRVIIVLGYASLIDSGGVCKIYSSKLSGLRRKSITLIIR